MITLETVLANVKAAHTRLVDVSARTEEVANKPPFESKNLQVSFSEAATVAKVTNESLLEVQQRSKKLVKTVEEV